MSWNLKAVNGFSSCNFMSFVENPLKLYEQTGNEDTVFILVEDSQVFPPLFAFLPFNKIDCCLEQFDLNR